MTSGGPRIAIIKLSALGDVVPRRDLGEDLEIALGGLPHAPLPSPRISSSLILAFMF